MPLNGNNNNSAYEVLNNAYKQVTGQTDLASIDLSDIVTTGQTWTDAQKDAFTKSLSSAYMSTKYVDSVYEDRTNDVFYEDSTRFGAVTRVIDIEIPDAIQSREWENFVSGSTTIGSNTIYLPVVNEQLYVTSTSWGVPIAFTGTQLDSAFESESGLLQFESYVRMVAENSVKYHKSLMNAMNRNNYIATKIALQSSQPNKKHVVNLVKEYCDYTGTASMTKTQYLNTPACLRHAVKTFRKYKALMMDMSTLFTANVNSNGKFCPYDRFVMQVLSDFEGMLESELYSGTFHEEFVKLPLYRDVSRWQAETLTSNIATFDTLSALKTENSSGNYTSEVDTTGIVALMVDKWAIMHTIIKNRVGVQRDDIKNIVLNDYQMTDKYINNLTLNGCVFVVQDVT